MARVAILLICLPGEGRYFNAYLPICYVADSRPREISRSMTTVKGHPTYDHDRLTPSHEPPGDVPPFTALTPPAIAPSWTQASNEFTLEGSLQQRTPGSSVKVFVSSVRRGLEVERDSLPGYIRSVGHAPVVFEDFTAQPIPSRQVCLEAVSKSDVYVLVLGALYGDEMPDTGLSPTEEEFIAARTRGLPILVFHKMGVTFEPKQEEFSDTVEKYANGSFRGEFTDANDLRIKLGSALARVEQSHQKLEWFPRSDIATPEPVLGRSSTEYRPLLVLSLVPISSNLLSTMQLRGIAQRAERVLREVGAVPQSSGLDTVIADDGSVIVRSNEQPPRATGGVTGFTPGSFGGITASPNGQVAAWRMLPRDFMGSLVDRESISLELGSLLRLIAQLEAIASELVSPCVRIDPADGVREGSPSSLGQRTSGPMSLRQGRALHTRPDDCIKAAVLASSSDEIADELAQRVIAALSQFH